VNDLVAYNGSTYLCIVSSSGGIPSENPSYWQVFAAGGTTYTNRGTWSGSTLYYVNDLVEYNGSTYLCIVSSAGGLPTNPTYWQLFASIGNTGPTGPTGEGSIGPTGDTGPAGSGGGSSTIHTLSITGTNQVEFDWSLGPNGLLEISPESTMTLNVINYPTTGTERFTLTVLIVQSASPYYFDAMTIGATPVSLFGFLNDTPPTPQARKFEIQTFEIFYGAFVFTKLESYSAVPPPP
jgi:hypothetical protein